MQSADSNIEERLEVTVKEIDSKGSVTREQPLRKVDMAQENLPKTLGAFFSAPSYANRFDQVLDASRVYRLVIRHPETGITDSAQTPVLDRAGAVIGEENVLNLLVEAPKRVKITAYPTSNTNPQHRAVEANGFLTIRYEELDTRNGRRDTAYFYLPFNAARQFYTSGLEFFEYSEHPGSFYGWIIGGIRPSGPEVMRHLLDCDITVVERSQSLQNYQEALQSPGLGENMVRPAYSNLMSTGSAIGIFTSQIMLTKEHLPIRLSMDTLKAISGAASRHFY